MIRLALKAKLYRNTSTNQTPSWNEVKNVKDLTLTLEKSEADVTTRGNDGWRATIGALKDASIEFAMVWDTADDDFTAIKDAWFNDTSIELAVMDGPIVAPSGGEASQGLRAHCAVLNFSRNEALEDAIMVDVSIKPTYAAQAPTWLTGTVTP
jgi:predicted secreted protein